MDNSVFRKRLFGIAERNGISLSRFAKEIGVHENSLYRLKSDSGAWLSLPAVITISRKYGVDANWLLGIDSDSGEQ